MRRLNTARGRDTTIKSELHILVKNRYVVLIAESCLPESSFNNSAKDVYKLADPVAAEKQLVLVAQYLTDVIDPERAGPGICMNCVLIDQWRAGFDEEKMFFSFHSTNDEQPKFEVNMFGRFGYDKETLFDRADRTVSQLSKLTDEVYFAKFAELPGKSAGCLFKSGRTRDI
jgi:hypothetical protein